MVVVHYSAGISLYSFQADRISQHSSSTLDYIHGAFGSFWDTSMGLPSPSCSSLLEPLAVEETSLTSSRELSHCDVSMSSLHPSPVTCRSETSEASSGDLSTSISTVLKLKASSPLARRHSWYSLKLSRCRVSAPSETPVSVCPSPCTVSPGAAEAAEWRQRQNRFERRPFRFSRVNLSPVLPPHKHRSRCRANKRFWTRLSGPFSTTGRDKVRTTSRFFTRGFLPTCFGTRSSRKHVRAAVGRYLYGCSRCSALPFHLVLLLPAMTMVSV